MKISVILPAAGLGRRFSVGDRGSASKIEFELWHKPVFLRAIELFLGQPEVEQIILAVDPQRLEDFGFRWADQLAFLGAGLPGGVKLIAGGAADRWETVKLALEGVSDSATHVAVHDAARPCASGAMIARVFAMADRYGAAVPGIAMGDTVKRVLGVEGLGLGEGQAAGGVLLDGLLGEEAVAVDPVGRITQTVDRAGLWRVQTPQVFEKGLLVEAYGKLSAGNAGGITDDASVVERAGGEVVVVAGDALNLKLTTREDVELMEAVLRMREQRDAKADAERALFGDEED